MSKAVPYGIRKPEVITNVDVKRIESRAIVQRVAFQRMGNRDKFHRPFIAWDGEATQDAGYCLLGNSAGMELCSPDLDTESTLGFMVEAGSELREAFHISYVFDYDVNNILKDLDWPHLILLKELGTVKWHGYKIKHIPGKSFSVSRDKRRIRIEDIFSYFRCPYCTGNSENPGALDKYDIGSAGLRADIGSGKSLRADFAWADIEYITGYFRNELATMPMLMDKIREACEAAKMYITSWYGPGALAKYELQKQNMRNHLAKTPDDMQLAVQTAYAGGWFDRHYFGYYEGPIYTADINSAYAWAMTLLPSLANGKWRYIEGEDARSFTGNFGVFHIRYGGRSDRRDWQNYLRACSGVPLPLWQRSKNGSIHRPFRTTGWYWNFEARQVHDDPESSFLGAWVLDHESVYPFDWISPAYDTRLLLKQAGDPAQLALKWMLASIYGTLAQRAGWKRRGRIAPSWHQLEYAGAITSACRSLLYTAGASVAGNVVSFDTDGIISTKPFPDLPHGKGSGLGQWECEEFSALCYFQNGIYWLRDMQGIWKPPKTRGIPYGQIGGVDRALETLDTGTFAISRHNFVGYGAALHRRDRSVWRTWQDTDYHIDITRSGSRQHIAKMCRACQEGKKFSEGLHNLAMVIPKENISQPHKLPWLEEDNMPLIRARVDKEMMRHEINMEVF